ncbi:hypothetical protein GSI_08675 [Ganoderma sinense ZZ0214-1]|uniref:Uncharacterized protein n=1 Tax=Ganoderma sinense ZZ0214-1 TaxID=1077348 RepID=A0A2G8S4C8_9APHY|nr:hypothetical protein GSI_08675 [Ganoderma sinense ZZ0214-1]
MEARRARSDGPSTGTGMHRAMDTDARRSSRKPVQCMVADLSRPHRVAHRARERNHPPQRLRTTLPAAALALCVTLSLHPLVSAEDSLVFHVPSEVTLCLPVNFTWTGGTPPYRLDVEPSINGVPNITANERRTGIQTTWILWTPDFPAGSRLEINVVGSGFAPSAGGFANVTSSSDSSCLNSASTTTTVPSSSSSAGGLMTPVAQPSATPSPAVLASSGGGLSKGAIAGIAIAAVLIGIGLIAFAIWYIRRRKNCVQQPEKGYDRNIVSPTLSSSDALSSSMPYSGMSSTLLSVDPNKLYAFSTPPTSVIASSSSSSGSPDPLRPTPYLVPRDSMSEIRKGKKHARELSNESAANLSVTTSDMRATSASPSQLGSSVDGQDEADAASGDILRFDADGAARLSLSLGSALGGSLGLGAFSDIGASDVGSNSGEATLPPPYANYLGGARIEEA